MAKDTDKDIGEGIGRAAGGAAGKDEGAASVGPVVLASHLASGALPQLSEMEYVLTVATNAFHRWMVRCMTAAGHPGMTPLDVLVMHGVMHKEREKTLSDLCVVLNVEDTHLVNYSLKKLEGMGLLTTGKRGKEKTARVTAEGMKTCERYHQIRENLLVESVCDLGVDAAELAKAARLLRAVSGQYDQAARSATNL